MVFFICDNCGETMKKKQVLQHTHRCRTARYSCMDCQRVFDQHSYKQHTKCITEDQKYGGANHVPKVNKGEQKQDAWVCQVRAAIRLVDEPRLKNLLRSIQSHTNIPRKESKFVSFLQNSLRVKNRELCVDAWNAIKEAAAEDAMAGKRKMVDDAEAESEPTEETVANGTATTTDDGGGEEEGENDTTEKRSIDVPQPPLLSIAPVKLKNKGTHIKFDD